MKTKHKSFNSIHVECEMEKLFYTLVGSASFKYQCSATWYISYKLDLDKTTKVQQNIKMTRRVKLIKKEKIFYHYRYKTRRY